IHVTQPDVAHFKPHARRAPPLATCHISAAARFNSFSFFFSAPSPPGFYTLSLHDALPICAGRPRRCARPCPVLSRSDRSRQSPRDRKSTRLNSSHVKISYAVFCLKKKKTAHEEALTQTPREGLHIPSDLALYGGVALQRMS